MQYVNTGTFASGRHLAAARTMAGLTRRELAVMAGLHVNSLKRLEQMTEIGVQYLQCSDCMTP